MARAPYASNMPLDVTAAVAIPASILNSTTYTSPVIPLYYGGSTLPGQTAYGPIVVALTADQIVTVTIQRFLDSAGLVAVDSVTSGATTANVASHLLVSAVVPALYFKVTVANASGSTAVVTNIGVGISAVTS